MEKIVVLSMGGSEGKTLLVTQCLYPNMPDAKILTVDTTNLTAAAFGIKCEAHAGDDFNTTYRALLQTKGNVIVDVGGSKECREFMEGMLAIDGSDKVTAFIIPSRPDSKGQSCGVETIEKLIDDGVAKEKIRVVFTGTKKSTELEFAELINGMRKCGLVPNLNLTINNSTLFNDMIEDKLLIGAIIKDTTDYNDKIETRAPDDKKDYAGMLIRQKMAVKTVWPNLQSVFNALNLNIV